MQDLFLHFARSPLALAFSPIALDLTAGAITSFKCFLIFDNSSVKSHRPSFLVNWVSFLIDINPLIANNYKQARSVPNRRIDPCLVYTLPSHVIPQDNLQIYQLFIRILIVYSSFTYYEVPYHDHSSNVFVAVAHIPLHPLKVPRF